MKSPQRSQQPSSSDDREVLLGALGFGACRRVQLACVVGVVINPRVLFEPGSQVRHAIQVRRVWRRELSKAFHVTAICRATPTDRATSAQPSPVFRILAARGRFAQQVLDQGHILHQGSWRRKV